MSQKCEDCKWFRIIEEPIKAPNINGVYQELGLAVCTKFYKNRRFMHNTQIKEWECIKDGEMK
jgi:hypothetical protein